MTKETAAAETPPINRPSEEPLSASCTKAAYIAIAIYVLVKFGEAVELYLPGVINQVVSCEVGVSHFQEGLLGVALHISYAVSMIGIGLWTGRFKRRPILLSSIYISIIGTIFCGLVPNYYTLLLSRVLIGLCLGVNAATVGVYFSENVGSRDGYYFGTFLSSFFFAVGSGWVAVLGYLLLDGVGWRWFVLFTSIPFFIPPIAMLHCCICMEDKDVIDSSMVEGKDGEKKTEKVTEEIVIPNITTRILKSSILDFANELQGYGTILLLPALLREDNKRSNLTGDPCDSAVQGSQFLILAAIFGGATLVGRVGGYFLNRRISFRVLQPILAIIVALSYGTILLTSNILVTVIAMGVANTVFSMMRLEIHSMLFDPLYFGTSTLVLGSGIMGGAGAVGSAVGSMLAVFLNAHTAVACTFVVALIQVVAVCSITGY